jgi:hypothetical protein
VEGMGLVREGGGGGYRMAETRGRECRIKGDARLGEAEHEISPGEDD